MMPDARYGVSIMQENLVLFFRLPTTLPEKCDDSQTACDQRKNR